jgi:hypothetical protein
MQHLWLILALKIKVLKNFLNLQVSGCDKPTPLKGILSLRFRRVYGEV